MLPSGASVLDVGCGDGLPAVEIMKRRPDVSISGIDVFVRDYAYIDVTPFDGRTIPFPDDAVDVVLFTDVLHHTLNKEELLAEAARVAARSVVIKDHLCETSADLAVLRGMDWVGNRHTGVSLPYAYWSEAQWLEGIAGAGLRVARWDDRLQLYPEPANAVFGRRLHVLAVLEPTRVAPIG